MPRQAKRDELGTISRAFLDPRSFVSRGGDEYLSGEDMSVRRHEIFERSGGFCEELGCNREINEELPSEHPNSYHMHHVRGRGRGGSDTKSNLQALCKRCHNRKHAGRSPQWSSAR